MRRFLTAGENLRPDGAVPDRKNKVWTADVTYLKVKKQWHYLSVIMNLFSRRIVGWSLDTTRTTQVTRRRLMNIIRKRNPSEELMLHTNCGIEYRGSEYQKELRRHGIVHMESFFHSLKAELIRSTVFKTKEELKYALARCINDFYNRKRLHSGINYCSPIEYERIAA